MMQPWQVILNALLFQATWLSAALLSDAVAGLCLIGLLASLTFSVIPLRAMLLGMSWAVLSGFSMDVFFNYLGLYRFDVSREVVPNTAMPIYLLVMWIGFAASLYVSVHWLMAKKVLFVLLCSVMGPLSYVAGRELGIIDFANEHIVFMVVGWGVWAVFFIWLYARLNRFANANIGESV